MDYSLEQKVVLVPSVTPHLTEEELDAITVVFHQYETGLREGTIYTKVRLAQCQYLIGTIWGMNSSAKCSNKIQLAKIILLQNYLGRLINQIKVPIEQTIYQVV